MKEKDPSLVQKYKELSLAEPELNSADLEAGDQLQKYIERKAADKNPITIHVGDKSIEVRKQFDRIIAGIKAFKPLGDSLASVAPIHAGLPWAGVCLLVSVCTNTHVLLSF